MNLAHRTRYILINIGKCLPFVLCFLVFVSYTETAFALATNDFIVYDGYLIPNKCFSWLTGVYLEYNVQTLLVLCVISIAIETCIYNKLACGYLGINLVEKSYFDFELDIWQIYTIAIANLIVSGYFTYKGIRILTKT